MYNNNKKKKSWCAGINRLVPGSFLQRVSTKKEKKKGKCLAVRLFVLGGKGVGKIRTSESVSERGSSERERIGTFCK